MPGNTLFGTEPQDCSQDSTRQGSSVSAGSLYTVYGRTNAIQLDAIVNPGLSKSEMKRAKQQERERRRRKKAKKKQARQASDVED